MTTLCNAGTADSVFTRHVLHGRCWVAKILWWKISAFEYFFMTCEFPLCLLFWVADHHYSIILYGSWSDFSLGCIRILDPDPNYSTVPHYKLFAKIFNTLVRCSLFSDRIKYPYINQFFFFHRILNVHKLGRIRIWANHTDLTRPATLMWTVQATQYIYAVPMIFSPSTVLC